MGSSILFEFLGKSLFNDILLADIPHLLRLSTLTCCPQIGVCVSKNRYSYLGYRLQLQNQGPTPVTKVSDEVEFVQDCAEKSPSELPLFWRENILWYGKRAFSGQGQRRCLREKLQKNLPIFGDGG